MLNQIRIIGSIIVTFVILNGCTTSVYYYNDGITPPSPKSESNINIYSEREINRECRELGYVTVYSTKDITGDELKRLLKEKAAEMGADAIIGFKLFGYSAKGIAVTFN